MLQIKAFLETRIFWLISFGMGIFFSLLICASHPWNSDLLYVEAILRDLMTGAHRLSEFHYSASTFLIPDYPIYMGLRQFTKNLNLTLLGYMAVQWIAFLALLRIWFKGLPSAAILFSVLAFFACFDSSWRTLFFPVHHGGQWILGLLILYRYGPLATEDKGKLVFSSVMCAALASCDLLFGVIALAPYVVSLGFSWSFENRKSKVKSDLLWIVVAFVLVFAFYFLFRKWTGAYFGWNKPLPGRWDRARDFLRFFVNLSFFTFVILIGLGFLGIRFKKDPIARFLLLSVLISASSIMMTGVWAGAENNRYFYALPFAILYSLTHLFFLINAKTLKGVFLATFLILMGFHIHQALGQWVQSPLSEPYTDAHRCLDQFVRDNGVKDGISSYWGAKWTTFLSKENARVLQVNEHFEPYYWINNHDWYKEFSPRFVVVNYFSDGEIPKDRLSSFGEPIKKVDCERFEVWLYSPGTELLKKPSKEMKYKNFQEFR